jgi:hypothetical protein
MIRSGEEAARRDGSARLTSTTPAEQPLAKKPNYDYEKRRKELERKQKKDAKREDRLQRRRDGNGDEPDATEQPDGAGGTDAPNAGASPV